MLFMCICANQVKTNFEALTEKYLKTDKEILLCIISGLKSLLKTHFLSSV